jgi:Dolichyl-phosphate-mannose-protein mannosyltransferase
MWAVGGIVFAVLMVFSPRYGFDRDELYFLDCARHLQAGYVDQPAFTPLLARVTLSAWGVSLPGLRLWPALAGGASVVVCGLVARELGGSGRAQLLAAVGAATMPTLIGADHILGPTAFDLLAWAVFALVVLRVSRTGDARWWLLGGLVLGIGLTNKQSVGFFALAVFAGALLSGGRGLVFNRWFLAGAIIAGLFTVPYLVWQAEHQWATVAMTRALNRENGGLGNVGKWVGGQLFMTSLAFIWIWMAGLRSLWRSGEPLQRALVWAYCLLFVLFAVTSGAKVYYLAGAYLYLLGAGAVAVDGWLWASRRRIRALVVATAITTAVSVPLVLPILPASDTAWAYGVNPVSGETVGWPELVSTVRSVWDSLPAHQRAHAVIFAADYGEAGAVNELGRGEGLPMAVSGHNNEWWWGPGNPGATTVVAVAPGPMDTTGYAAFLAHYFTSVRTVATLTNGPQIHNQEWGGHIYVCTGLRRPWGEIWPQLRHYS